jgi:hypothetical protein
LIIPAKQPTLKGRSFQLAQGAGPQSNLKRSRNEQRGRLHSQPDCGSSPHGSEQQGLHDPVSAGAVQHPVGAACTGAGCPSAAESGATVATIRNSTSLQMVDKGKPYRKISREAVGIMPTQARHVNAKWLPGIGTLG